MDERGGLSVCPKNSECFGGIELPRPSISYWVELQRDKYAGNVYRCPRATCSGGLNLETACFDRGGTSESCPSSLICALGASSPLCGSCDEGFSYAPISQTCISCDESSARAQDVLISLAISAAFIAGAVIVARRISSIRQCIDRIIQAALKIDRLSVSGALRVLYCSYQIIGSITVNAEVFFPSLFHPLISTFGGLSGSFVPYACLFRLDHIEATLAWSSVLPILLVLNFLVHIPQFANFADRAAQKDASRSHARVYLILMFILVPAILEKELLALGCVLLNGKRYLRIDTAISCDSTRFQKFAAVDAVFIAVYISIPLLFAVLLWRKRALIRPRQSGHRTTAKEEKNKMKGLSRVKFLFDIYTPQFYLYEPFEMLRRIFFVGFIPLMADSPTKRAGVGVFASFLSVIVRREAWPYVRQSTCLLAYVSDVTVLLTYLSAFAINSGLHSGFDPIWFGAGLCFVNLSGVGLALHLGMIHVRKEYALSQYHQALSDGEHAIFMKVMNVSLFKIAQRSGVASSKTLEAEIETEDFHAESADRVLKQHRLAAKDIRFESVLGSGAYGKVFRGTFHGQPVAIKTMLDVTEESARSFRAEILLTATLRSPYVVTFLGACLEQSCVCLVLEFAPGGTLDGLLDGAPGNARGEAAPLRWTEPLLGLAIDVARGLEYLHGKEHFDEVAGTKKNCILHRDLKVTNISAALSAFR